MNHIPSQTFCVSRRYFELREINVVMTIPGTGGGFLTVKQFVCGCAALAGWDDGKMCVGLEA